VAPLEADSWNGISTPCSMLASLPFAVITRGAEMISPRPSRLCRRDLEVDDVVGVEQRHGQLARGFAIGRLTM
jgi:hypothetical protein